ncbi:MAG: hypothetical protein ABIG61_09050 [Planctomycetota bacterium]
MKSQEAAEITRRQFIAVSFNIESGGPYKARLKPVQNLMLVYGKA